MTNTPTTVDGPQPHHRLYGYTGRAPIKTMTRMMRMISRADMQRK